MSRLKNGFQKIIQQDWKKLFLELLVVFLGVTAGFLLNSWQAKQQNAELEKKYLEGFMEQCDSHINELNLVVNFDTTLMRTMRPLMNEWKAKDLPTDSIKKLIGIIQLQKGEFKTSVYEDIINSGNLNLINHSQVKNMIINYYMSISTLKFIDEYLFQYYQNNTMQFVMNNYDVLRQKFIDEKIINTSKFSNPIVGFYGILDQQKKQYQEQCKKSIILRDSLKKVVSSLK